MNRRSSIVALCLIVLVALAGSHQADATSIAVVTSLISVSTDGLPGNDYSVTPAITADARYVVFASTATDLTDDPIDEIGNIFIRDRLTARTYLVSRAMDGTAAGGADSPSVSADGRFVAYKSPSSDIVADDDNDASDVFVVDRATGQTTLMSGSPDGAVGDDGSILPAISADGRYVAFVSQAQNRTGDVLTCCRNVYLHDLETGQTTLVSKNAEGEPGYGDSTYPALSADGHFITFESGATNLVSEDDTNGGGVNGSDVFVYDRQTATMTRISRSSDGTQANNASVIPSISADGRLVAFQSFATNLVAPETSGWANIYVHDRLTGATTLVSKRSDGTPGDYVSRSASISADGRYVAFGSLASNLVDDGGSGQNAFRHDRLTGETILVSRHTDGTPADNPSGVSLSARSLGVANNGDVVFESGATNLIDADENGALDIFARGEEMAPLAYSFFVPLVSADGSSR